LFRSFAPEVTRKRQHRRAVDALPQANAAAVAAAIAGGSLDCGVGDLISPVNAIAAGVPLAILAAGALYRTTDDSLIVAVGKNSPIRRPHDLAGKTIGVPTLVGLSSASLRAWLPANGVDLASVKIVEIPQAATAPAMERGTIDAGILSEPFITLAGSDVRDLGHPLDIIAPVFLNTAWYASRSWVERDPQRARRAVSAIYATAAWANAHRADTLDILVRAQKLDPAAVGKMARATYATTLDVSLIQPVLDFATRTKIFDRPIDANALLAKP